MTIQNEESANFLIPPREGAAFILRRGQLLRVTDIEGGQVSDLVCFSYNRKQESLSAGRTLYYNGKLFLTSGDHLYSIHSRPMLSIEGDTLGGHSCLNAPCSWEMFDTAMKHSTDPSPNCLDNLGKELMAFGVHGSQIGTPFNLFINIKIEPFTDIFNRRSVRFDVQPARSKAGEYIELKALMDLVVGLTACSHDRFNSGQPKPIGVQISAGRQRNGH